MNGPNCYLCTAKKTNLLYSVKQWNIYKCDECSYVFVYPLLTQKQLKELYFRFKNNIFEKSKIIFKDAKHSLRFINRHKKGRKTLLDIGCGNGIFLNEAARRRWIVTGIDISLSLINYLKKTFKYEVFQGDVLNTDINRKYDIVTLNQVIEHFSKPRLLIKRCYDFLDKEGLIYIATPNISSTVSRIRKNSFDYIIPPEHLSYFNIKTLYTILTSEGFRVLEFNTWSYPVDLAGLIKYFMNKRTHVDVGNTYKSTKNRIYIKYLKYLLFDQVFCRLFYKLLNINNGGTMIEVLAIKQ